MTLRILPPTVAAKIAAGEVIERPASALKELLENALDAGATAITVEIVGGGRRLIRVRDNGIGLPAGDVVLAFERHATSKIATADDLLSIHTLGFRGEALPSIASVADVTFVTRPADAVGGYAVRFQGGGKAEEGPQGAPPGTTVSVQDLFLDFPARRKFLRSDNAEAGHCVTIATQYALARPEVRFTVLVDNKPVLRTPGSGVLRDAAAAVLGTPAAAALVELPVIDTTGLPPEQQPLVQVTGLVSPPGITRSTRAQQSIFVNGRWVQHRSLAYAIEEAYQGALMVGRHPIAILYVTLPPDEVDVNVHPRKTEVRFRHDGEVYSAVQKAIKAALAGSNAAKDVLPEIAPASGILRQWDAPETYSQPELLPSTGSSTPASMDAGRRWPVLRVVGQVNAMYVITEGPDGLYLVDQHAAHERVVYEQVAQQAEGRDWESQGLIEPALLSLAPASLVLLEQSQEQLARLGFVLEPFGEQQLLVRALPKGLRTDQVAQTVTDLVESLQEGQSRFDRVLATIACHSAVRAGDVLALDEMRALLRDLESCTQPQTCPHGRPTMMHLSASQLEREFGRRG